MPSPDSTTPAEMPESEPAPESEPTHVTVSREFHTTVTVETDVGEDPAERLRLGERWEGSWEVAGVVAVWKDDDDKQIVPRVIWKRVRVKTRRVVVLTGHSRAGRTPHVYVTNDDGSGYWTLLDHHRVAIRSAEGWELIWRNTTSGETFCGARWPFADGDSATAAELESIGFLIEPATTRSPEPRC